jgi:serine phosphatase RsbU (regulator of sigma subunit)
VNRILLSLTLVFLVFTGNVFAQSKKFTDSVLKVIQGTNVDTIKAWSYNELAAAHLNSNPFLSKYYGNKAKEIFEKLRSPIGTCFSSLKIAAACRMLNEEANMLENVKMALSLAEKLHDKELLSGCYHEMALISNTQNDIEKSLAYNLKALDFTMQTKDKKELAGIYNNLGICFARKNDWANGLKYFKLALEHERIKGNSPGLANEINNIGIYYIFKKEYDSAFYYLSEAKKMRANDKLGTAGSMNNLALYYMAKGKDALALKYADSSLNLAKELNNKTQEEETLLSFYSIYEHMDDYENALWYFRQHENLRKKLESESNNRKLSEIQSSIDLEMKEKELLEKTLELKDANAEKRKRNLALILTTVGLALCGFVIWLVVRANKKVKFANRLVKEQKKRVEEQKTIIEVKHKDITDSIFYAQKIQQAVIIPEINLRKSIPESFVIYQPRDIVSGDFYWFAERNGYKILAVADCTGHGVPGAFMSLIGISSLSQIVMEKGIVSPAKILDELKEKVIASFNQASDEAHRRDGMDIGIIALAADHAIYAGANNPCLHLRGAEITAVAGNKQPVGYYENSTNFNEERIILQKNDSFYLFTDGVVDQFGGPKGKKLKIKHFKEWIRAAANLPMEKQREFLDFKLAEWKGHTEQTDDICLAGIKNT